MNLNRRTTTATDDALVRYRIAAIGIVLAAYLARQRVVWVLAHSPGESGAARLRGLVAAPFEDLLYVLLLVAGFSAATWLLGRATRWRRLVWWLYLVVVVLSVIFSIVNLIALTRLRQPISYQWLYYSDFLLSLDVFNTMHSLLNWILVRNTILLSLFVVIAGMVLARVLEPLLARERVRRRLLPATAVAVATYILVAASELGASGIEHPYRANPVAFLLASFARPGQYQGLATVRTPIGPEDFAPTTPSRPVASARPGSPIRIVFFFVLESVRASDVGAVGGRRGITPTIDSAARFARVYPNAYAHVPSTGHSLVSMLLSVYTPHSFRILTRESPTIALPSLAEALGRQGYRTGFFNGADNRFQRTGEFLAAHGVDHLADYRSFQCGQEVFTVSDPAWPFASGTSARCAVSALLDWVDAARDRPFLALLWNMETHDPYFATGTTEPFDTVNATHNRYLNALHRTDEAFGSLLRALAERGLSDSTLIVVVGDHGEAFGEHAHTNHFLLYQEDLHVPLLLINPRLFRGETDTTLAGLIDLAPTVMTLLGLVSPDGWQGRSLFDRSRTGRVYFFAPFSSVYFGYLEGTKKVIYNASGDTWELYDVRADPGERHNLARQEPEALRRGRDRLAAWVQYQREFYRAVPGEPLPAVGR
jgi:arylsulfatase A-like enzyme